ncbi:helix-turn-helix domain-containing protein [Paenibacillus agricola]|uniref:AraC family transcriptional regulator n=1 Tax=Paenibacillus agricola TaxID=2716264 RepID=A0ABX0J149_9BACL|nr:helix-turn-helix domain-containing protein [Paenibacillus agricola]NHN29161.1 AraC family transcriptional regulator [Paenibacillus agricola]
MWKVKRKSSGFKGIFLHLLVPNIILLLLPLLVGWIIYNKTLLEMEKEVTASNMNLLQQSRNILDRRLSEISSIAMQLANDTRIMQFASITNPFEGANTYRVLETRKSMYNFSLSNNFIFNYFISFKNSGLVLAESSTYMLPEFEKSFQYTQMDTRTWNELFMGGDYKRKVLPAQDVTVNGHRYSLLTYIHPMGYPGFPQGSVAITVDHREIQKLLGGLDLSGGWAYIINEAGDVVSSTSPGADTNRIDLSRLNGQHGNMLQEIAGQDMMVTYTTSDYNGWTYLVAQPADVVLNKVLYIKKITFSLVFSFLVVGLLIAYLIAYRNSRPLKKIMETIMERTNGEGYYGSNAYHFIRDHVSRLIANNQEMQDKMEKQAPLLQAALFGRLLTGEYVTPKDIPILLQHVGITMRGSYFIVAILQLRGYDNGLDRDVLEELDRKRVMVKDIIYQETNGQVYMHDVAEDQIVLLFAFDVDAPAKRRLHLEEVTGRISENVQSSLSLATRLGVGNIYEDLLNISRSFEEAKRTLEYLSWRNKNGMMGFDELPKDNHGYYYPADLEYRLSNLAKAGEHTAVSELLGELRCKNFEERRLSVTMLRLFMNEMWGTLIKLLPQVGMEEDTGMEQMKPFSGDLASYTGLENNYRSLTSVFGQVCDFVNNHKKSQNVQLYEHIVSLLQESYAQAELCLDSVAECMNISKGYLSQFFKEQAGVNFSDYLEELRMAHAKELLASTQLPVYEIAQQVGYSSSNTFCRAFKRIHAVSTSEFRRVSSKMKAYS